MIPPFDRYLQPFMETLKGGEEKYLKQISEELAAFFSLTDDDLAEMVAKGTQSRHYNRVSWAGTYSYKAGLTRRTKPGCYQITDFGMAFMKKRNPINQAILKAEIPQFAAFAESAKSKPKEPKSIIAEANGKNNMNFGKNADYWLYSELTKLLSAGEGFEIEQEVRWGPPSDYAVFDITVRKNGYLTTVFEVQDHSQGAVIAGVIMPYYVFNHTPASLCIVYNSENHAFYLYNRKKIGGGDQNVVYYDDDFDHEIKDRHANDLIVNELNIVVQHIKRVSERQIAELIPKPSKNVDNQFGLKFYGGTVLDPRWCREQLGVFTDDKICRYSSLDSLFSTLKYGTFRMNGIPGMNDKDEGLFAWNLINNTHKLSTNTGKERQELNNNVFIISYSDYSKRDNLSMWRLYGDDSRGVCCVFSVLKDKIKDRFFLHKVKYIEPPLEGQALNDDMLTKLKSFINLQSDKKNLDFSPIVFYYKHKDYEIEDEVRLLVDNKETSAYIYPRFKSEWLLTSSNCIPNPYIDIQKDDFPLKLERIILGPNMNDIDTIQVQLETLLRQNSIKAEVELSEKTSYRNPVNR